MMIVVASDYDYILYALQSLKLYKKIKIVTREYFGVKFFDRDTLNEDALVIVDEDCVQAKDFPISISISHDKSADLQKPFHISALVHLINQKLKLLNNYVYPGNFSFFFAKRLLMNNQKQSLSITEKEASLLEYLLKNRNKFISKQEILREIWQYKGDLETTTLETHLYSLKVKFKQLCIYIFIEIQKDQIKFSIC
jgi:hypothetical protein